MAYDPIRHRTLLFGGQSVFGLANDTWVWDGTNWTEMSRTLLPEARYGGAFAFDALEGRLVLFGGWGSGGFLADTWEWDGANWFQRTPLNSPQARVAALMSATSDGGVVLFGGAGKALLDDTWTWNGNNWKSQAAGNSPPARDFGSMAYDPASGMVILFGGQEKVSRVSDTPSNDTWAWQRGAWVQLTPALSPDKRESSAMAADATGRIVLFGGVGYYGNVLGDTWQLTL
jgi:hypothetical protein